MRHKEIIMTGPFSAYIVMRQGTALLVLDGQMGPKGKKDIDICHKLPYNY